MELQGVIAALGSLTRPCSIDLWTDSRYVQQGITVWITNWKQRGWKTAQRTPVKNQELWQRLDTLCQDHTIQWHWVKGHSGHRENERADQLARGALQNGLQG